MDVDPMEMVESEDEEEKDEAAREKRKSRLNNWVAIAVALLATFMGICKVKDDNIVQAMQQAQAKSVDAWAWYQAKKIRLQFAQATADQFAIQAQTAAPNVRPVIEQKMAEYNQQAAKQATELADVEKQARGYDKEYDRLNFHDDQFDLSDALLAIAISLLALTALTQKRWLFAVAMVPTFFGVLMGLAGLFNLNIHSDFFAKLLGT
ncbi:MAG TPA: DUF4337 domain-containing protein [Chthonomonadaceae bacterium]|nr:DUF4337 domain-containing protein [Chthonomonadaceae bacterium]